MEDLDQEIINELKKKAIERGEGDTEITTNELDEELKEPSPEPITVVEQEPPKEVKKTKKQRSQKQIEAFEKARQKRAENLKIKKQLEAEKKEAKKAEKELVKKQVKERLEKKETLDLPPMPRGLPQEVNHITQRYKEVEEQPRYREQVVNNYYYYGTPPPEVYHAEQQPKPKRGRKKKVKSPPPPPEPESESSSESEEEIIYSDPEEPESFKELQNYNEDIDRQLPPKQNNSLKFRFA